MQSLIPIDFPVFCQPLRDPGKMAQLARGIRLIKELPDASFYFLRSFTLIFFPYDLLKILGITVQKMLVK